MNKDYIEYYDRLSDLKGHYSSIMNKLSTSTDIFEIMYLENMLKFIIPDGKLDLETALKLREKIEGITTEMCRMFFSDENIVIGDKDVLLKKELEEVKDYNNFLLVQTMAGRYFSSIEGSRELVESSIDKRINMINSSISEYKSKKLVRNPNFIR